nr:phage tail domain-containing protein [uncultured Aminipila sp.]
MITDIILHNIELDKTIKIGTDNRGYVLGLVDFGQAPATQKTTPYINLIGTKVMSTKLDTRSISIKGAVFGYGKSIALKKRELNRIINPSHTLIIECGNYKISVRANASVSYSNERLRNGSNFCEFLIQCTAFEPVFKRKNEEVVYYSNARAVPLFPMIIPAKKGICFGQISQDSIKNIVNDGDIETGFVARFIADEGAVKNPKITNNKSGKFIEIIINMEKGDMVEVSTISGSKYAKFIRGNSQTDILNNITKKSTMSLCLNTGVNDILISAARNESNLNNVIKFTPLYLEVEE